MFCEIVWLIASYCICSNWSSHLSQRFMYIRIILFQLIYSTLHVWLCTRYKTSFVICHTVVFKRNIILFAIVVMKCRVLWCNMYVKWSDLFIIYLVVNPLQRTPWLMVYRSVTFPCPCFPLRPPWHQMTSSPRHRTSTTTTWYHTSLPFADSNTPFCSRVTHRSTWAAPISCVCCHVFLLSVDSTIVRLA